MKNLFLLALFSAMLFVSCEKDKTDDTIDTSTKYTLVGKETADNDLTVELYSKTTTLEVGYQNLYVKVKDAQGDIVKNATVLFEPEMDMGQMQHGSPVVQPVYSSKSKLYEGTVIFTMPSGSMGSWVLAINVNGSDVVLPVEISPSKTGTKYVGSYSGTDAKKYFVTLVKPFSWKVGMNDFSIMIHNVNVDHEFVPVEGLLIEFDPQMTSMSHGSPNNVNPTDKTGGYYKGKVNLTMTGDWRLFFDIYAEGELIIEDAYIDILF